MAATSAADEPRRSGRATKGQHKNLDGDETQTPRSKKNAATPAATPAPSANKKSAKKAAKPDPEEEEEDDEEDEDDDDDENIRCVCGVGEDPGRTDFVQCDACQVWQHNVCMDLPLEEYLLPPSYLCEQCSPDDHKPLLAAIERGEKPWNDRLRALRNAKKRGKNRRKTGDRRSTASELKSDKDSKAVSSSPAPAQTPAPAPVPASASTPTPAPVPSAASVTSQEPAGTKRKFEDEGESSSLADPTAAQSPSVPAATNAAPASADSVDPATTSTPETTKRASSAETKRAEKRRKSSAPAAEDGKEADTETALVDIDQLPAARKNVAVALSKVISEDIEGRVKAASYHIPDGYTAASLGDHHASRIEYALYMNHGPFVQGKPTEAYRTQFRALLLNLKTNALLIDRLLKSDLTADELSSMQPQDMASEEKQKQLAEMKEEVQKQSVMVQEDDMPRVRRTHKGDEYVDDASHQPTEPVYTSRPVRHRDSQSEAAIVASPTTTTHQAGTASDDRMDIDKPEGIKSRRTSSQQFDIGGIWAKTQHSPGTDQQRQQDSRPLLQQPPRRRSSIQRQAQEKGEKVDADVDRMLADDDNDDDEYNPADLTSSDGNVVWRGQLVQPGVTQLTTTGRFVAGNDFGRYIPWTQFLPKILEIEGRLEAKRADDYLCGLQWSKKSDVAVLALSPYNDRPAFDQIFEYFATRSRYAVIRKGHGMSDIVKDVYVSPVEKGGPLPPHIELLEHNSFDTSLPDRVLIVTFVVNKPAHWDNPATAPIPFDAQVAQAQNSNGNGLPPHLRNGPLASPINAQSPGPAFSPGPQAQNGGYPYGALPNSIPPNPYGSQPPSAGPTPPQFPNMTSYPPAPAHPDPRVAQILGHFANAPTVQQILSNAGSNIADNILEGMKSILTSDPSAAEDITRFKRHLGLPPTAGH